MVVIDDGRGGKVVVQGRDGQTDGWSYPLAIKRVCVKTKLRAQIHYFILSPINIIR